MAKNSNSVVETVRQLAEPIADSLDCWVWDVEFVKEAGTQYLRVYLDKAEGVSIVDCENFSRALDPILDEADPIPCSYVFEVGSAGIERELKRPSDFEKFMGAQVSVKLYQAVNGQKNYVGDLAAYDNGDITLTVGKNTVLLKKAQVAQVKLHVDF